MVFAFRRVFSVCTYFKDTLQWAKNNGAVFMGDSCMSPTRISWKTVISPWRWSKEITKTWIHQDMFLVRADPIWPLLPPQTSFGPIIRNHSAAIRLMLNFKSRLKTQCRTAVTGTTLLLLPSLFTLDHTNIFTFRHFAEQPKAIGGLKDIIRRKRYKCKSQKNQHECRSLCKLHYICTQSVAIA